MLHCTQYIFKISKHLSKIKYNLWVNLLVFNLQVCSIIWKQKIYLIQGWFNVQYRAWDIFTSHHVHMFWKLLDQGASWILEAEPKEQKKTLLSYCYHTSYMYMYVKHHSKKFHITVMWWWRINVQKSLMSNQSVV